MSKYFEEILDVDLAIAFARYGGGSSKNKQEYKPDIKLEYYDDNGRFLSPKEVQTAVILYSTHHHTGLQLEESLVGFENRTA